MQGFLKLRRSVEKLVETMIVKSSTFAPFFARTGRRGLSWSVHHQTLQPKHISGLHFIDNISLRSTDINLPFIENEKFIGFIANVEKYVSLLKVNSFQSWLFGKDEFYATKATRVDLLSQPQSHFGVSRAQIFLEVLLVHLDNMHRSCAAQRR